jgi:hypothetical protein
MKKLKTAGKGAEKLMPLHKRVATGNKPVMKPSREKVIKRK